MPACLHVFTFDLHVLAGKGLDEFLFAGVGMTSREHVITHINKLNTQTSNQTNTHIFLF